MALAIHRRFDPTVPRISGTALPADAPVLREGREMLITLRCRSLALNGRRSGRDADCHAGMASHDGVWTPCPSQAWSPAIDETASPIWSSKFGIVETLATSSGVNSTAAISWVSASTPRCSFRHRFFCHPDREVPPQDQRGIIFSPNRHRVSGLGDLVTAICVEFIGHGASEMRGTIATMIFYESYHPSARRRDPQNAETPHTTPGIFPQQRPPTSAFYR